MECSLPNEIWLRTFSLFHATLESDEPSNHHDPTYGKLRMATLHSVSHASKQFQALAQPILYHTISMTEHSQGPLLFRTLTESAHLAEMVKELRIALPSLTGWAEAMRNIAPGAIAEEAKGTYPRYSDSVIASFLALTPNLEVLDITVPPKPKHILTLFREAVKSLATPTDTESSSEAPREVSRNRFSGLREVRLQPSLSAPYPVTMVNIKELIKELTCLPALRTLRGHRLTWRLAWGTNCSEIDYQSGVSCKLEHIYLDRTEIFTAELGSLLSHCANLKTLQIGWEVPYSGLTCGEIGDALRAHGRGLETLELTFGPSREYSTHSYHDYHAWQTALQGKIGPLQDLASLKHLKIPLEVLVGSLIRHNDTRTLHLTEVLPRSLETLQFDDYDYDRDSLAEDILDLLESENSPNLRQIYRAGVLSMSREVGSLGWTIDLDEDDLFLTNQDARDSNLKASSP